MAICLAECFPSHQFLSDISQQSYITDTRGRYFLERRRREHPEPSAVEFGAAQQSASVRNRHGIRLLVVVEGLAATVALARGQHQFHRVRSLADAGVAHVTRFQVPLLRDGRRDLRPRRLLTATTLDLTVELPADQLAAGGNSDDNRLAGTAHDVLRE